MSYFVRKMWLLVSAYFLCSLSGVSCEIYLEKLDTLYLPYTVDPSLQYGLGKDAAEQSGYDTNRHLVFAAGATMVHVVSAADPLGLRLLTSYTDGPNTEMTDVEVCGSYIFVGIDNLAMRENGWVIIFRYNELKNQLEIVHRISVGALPDMVMPTKDCNTIFVALEAEAYVDPNNNVIDPEAGFGIIRWDSTNPTIFPSYRLVDFKKFNSRVGEYVAKGVRFVYRENNNTLSQDLEPEYITLNKEETMAYVCLQENNAIAVVNITDLDTADIIDIYPIGWKDWSTAGIDPSDKDDGVNLNPWPVHGSYQPDAIKYFVHQGQGYILTANEGDSKVYTGELGQELFSEELRGNDFIKGNLTSPDVSADMIGYFSNDAQLGRLKLSLSSRLVNDSGKYKEFFAFGGRGFSIIRASDMKMIYDSGDDVEKSIAKFYPDLFNSDAGNPGVTPKQSSDSRSDDKGPECEMITYGHLWDKTVIFLGNERPGTISIYSMTDDSIVPTFESLYFGGALVERRTWQEMYDQRSVGDIDPEDVRFIAPEDSPTGEPMVLVTATVSGTVAMYAVRMRESPIGGTTEPSIAVCGEEQLKCRNTNICVSFALKCDGVNDCGDNTDEADCKLSTDETLTRVLGLTVAVVCLTSLSVILLLALCLVIHRKTAQNAYEMKTTF